MFFGRKISISGRFLHLQINIFVIPYHDDNYVVYLQSCILTINVLVAVLLLFAFIYRHASFSFVDKLYFKVSMFYFLAGDYFIINCQHSILQFYDGEKLHIGFDKKPRILDMCFLKLDSGIHLVYIDADNKRIVIRDISKGSVPKDETLSEKYEPNRMCKLNNSTVGVIFKKGLQILIFDIIKMAPTATYSISQGDITKDGCIQGILAFSQTELILTDKISLYHCELLEHDKITKVKDFAPLNCFDTARRLTHVTISRSGLKEVVFVADENDKKLTSIERTSKGNYIDTQADQNRGLQNVRAIGATEDRVYAATSAGISVFCHENGYFKKFETRDNGIADYRMIVEYYKHVEHTRGLCIQLDNDHIFIGLSCIIKQEDVILIFKFKPDDIFK